MSMQVTASVSITGGTTKAALIEAIKAVPDGAKISIRSYTADRPGESSYSTMTFTWSI